ncbi:hypothetical protein [Legionella tucsonensis]|uniref:Uncharacterized protein n=1 Tax=Legionella tucsonensis TaxID=40335 RepID=A0A0W0ZZ39_9GAMM|nr:hypothetical protein [Legionella tucsonensis]KTD74373.1 hypothetical protein Ltuc_2220 [Legionella tucsonensis]
MKKKFQDFKKIFKNRPEVDLPMSDEERTVSKIRVLLNEEISHFEKVYKEAGYNESHKNFKDVLTALKDLSKNSNTIITKEAFLDAIEETREKLPQKESKMGSAMAFGIGDGSRNILDKVEEELKTPESKLTP